jgi:hypothetical protein
MGLVLHSVLIFKVLIDITFYSHSKRDKYNYGMIARFFFYRLLKHEVCLDNTTFSNKGSFALTSRLY